VADKFAAKPSRLMVGLQLWRSQVQKVSCQLKF